MCDSSRINYAVVRSSTLLYIELTVHSKYIRTCGIFLQLTSLFDDVCVRLRKRIWKMKQIILQKYCIILSVHPILYAITSPFFFIFILHVCRMYAKLQYRSDKIVHRWSRWFFFHYLGHSLLVLSQAYPVVKASTGWHHGYVNITNVTQQELFYQVFKSFQTYRMFEFVMQILR